MTAARGKVSRRRRRQRAGRPKRQTVTTALNAFRRLMRELRLSARKTEKNTGLSAAQLFVLSAAEQSSGCSINDVAEATMTDRSSVAAIVDRLVTSGHLKRTKSKDDRRRASIVLTARGRRAAQSASPAPTTLLIRGLTAMPPAQLRALRSGLDALTRAMGIADHPARMLFEEEHPRPGFRPAAAGGAGAPARDVLR